LGGGRCDKKKRNDEPTYQRLAKRASKGEPTVAFARGNENQVQIKNPTKADCSGGWPKVGKNAANGGGGKKGHIVPFQGLKKEKRRKKFQNDGNQTVTSLLNGGGQPAKG